MNASNPDWQNLFAGRVAGLQASEIRELLKLLARNDIIAFAGGVPDPELFPTAAFAEAFSQILNRTDGAQALQYSASEGHPPLRDWIAAHTRARGMPCSADNILITNGSQQGLDLLGRILLSPGDTALVEAPTYLGALQAFDAYEPRYDLLPGQGDNRTPEAYAEAAGGKDRIKFAYAVPDFANPTGRTMDLAARDALLAALERHMPAGVTWHRPEGGMFVWVTLPDGMDAAKLLARSVEQAGVTFVPDAPFHPTGGGAGTLRLSYSLATPAQIDTGMARLAEIIAKST